MAEKISEGNLKDYKKIYDYILDGVKQWQEEVWHDLDEIEADLEQGYGRNSVGMAKLLAVTNAKAEMLDELIVMIEEAPEEAY